MEWIEAATISNTVDVSSAEHPLTEESNNCAEG